MNIKLFMVVVSYAIVTLICNVSGIFKPTKKQILFSGWNISKHVGSKQYVSYKGISPVSNMDSRDSHRFEVSAVYDSCSSVAFHKYCYYQNSGKSVTCEVDPKYVYCTLKCINVSVENVLFRINNAWKPDFPFMPPVIYLQSMPSFLGLKSFRMIPVYKGYSPDTILVFSNNTFVCMKNVTTFQINIDIQDIPLDQILVHMPNLQILDLSNTRSLSISTLTKGLSHLKKDNIKAIRLSQFQHIGSSSFSLSLNISSLLGSPNETSLEELDLSNNYLAQIYPGITLIAPNLTKFDVSGNLLVDPNTLPILYDGFFHRKLKEFNIGYQGYVLSKPAQNKNNNSKLSDTDLKDVSKGFNIEFLSTAIQCANHNNAKHNISDLFQSSADLCKIVRCIFYRTYDSIPCSIYPALKDIYDFSCSLLIHLPIFRNLETLIMDNMHYKGVIGTTLKDKICFMNSSLSTFSFRNNNEWIQSLGMSENFADLHVITGLINWSEFDFSGNLLEVDLRYINHPALNAVPNIKRLSLNRNRIKLGNSGVCRQGAKLKEVHVALSNLTVIPVNSFVNCSEIEIIDLSQNHLTHESLEINISHNTHIKLINISNNEIGFIPITFQKELDELIEYGARNVTLDIVNNPISCRCRENEKHFLKWYHTTKINIYKAEQIICTGPKADVFIERFSYKDLEIMCQNQYLKTILVTVASLLSFIILITFSLGLYHYRYRIGYSCFRLKKRIHAMLSRENNNELNYKYDAFVSYCADDRFWVHSVLMKTLEKRYGFNLCIHYRDFPLGGFIADTIIRSIRDSKSIIIVISDTSLERPWCEFELEVAIREANIYHKTVIVIKLGEVTKISEVESAAWLTDTQTNLEWAEKPGAEKLFWAKLVWALYGEGSESCSVCCCCCRVGQNDISYKHIEDFVSSEANTSGANRV